MSEGPALAGARPSKSEAESYQLSVVHPSYQLVRTDSEPVPAERFAYLGGLCTYRGGVRCPRYLQSVMSR